VFVVEDEKLVATDLQQHLEMLGYEVPAIMASGEEALKRASEAPPDLVLMDIQLKGRIDGIDTARILQTRLNIPVIYVTAFADNATFNRAKATEPYGYVVKPFGRKELQTAIELALHKHGRERSVRTHEQWLMALIANLGAGIITTDPAGLVCMMNPKAEQYTGVPLAEALGVPWADLFAFPDARDQRDTPIWRAIHENTVTEMLDTRVVFTRSGRKGIVCGAVSAMGAPGGNDRSAIMVFRDISAWLHLENQYAHARHLEDMQRLAGALGHQFANYVTLISGYSESLARGMDQNDGRVREVRTIQKVTDRAAALTRDLLAFSRGQTPMLKVIDANRTITGICEIANFSLGSNISLELQLDTAGVKIESDPGHLEQILMALVANAKEAMPGGGVVTVRSSKFDVDDLTASRFVDLPPGPYVRIDVSDTGVGMSYETQSHIFEPFFTTKPQNTGLGLSAAFGLVKQNRGHIWFESEPQKGSTFTVCLPRIEALAREAFSLPASLRGSETILVVDSDSEDRAQTRDVLLELGYRVIEASGGNEAVRICEQKPGGIDLVLSVVVMPNMTGFELARRVQVTRPSMAVLFMSKYSEYALRHHGAFEEGRVMLQKPFSAEALARAVSGALQPLRSAAGGSSSVGSVSQPTTGERKINEV
jgi:PAS domain S-box-containing protein